jgi:hypothetical protein
MSIQYGACQQSYCTLDSSRGKAAGLDGLSLEHLIFFRPILLVILSKLFNLMLSYNLFPSGVHLSYTVHHPIRLNSLTEAMMCI